MDKIISSVLFLVFALLVLSQNEELIELQGDITKQKDSVHYVDGINKGFINSYEEVSSYRINAELDINEKIIKASQKIKWFNRTDFKTNKLFFHLYPNGYKIGSEFSKGYKFKDEHLSSLEISTLKINHKEYQFEYDITKSRNSKDSTIIRVDLDFEIMPNDSIEIYFEFQTKVPLSLKRFGYAEGRNFFFISQWFPKIAVFENEEWLNNPYYSYTNYYADFGNYYAELTVPKNFVVGSSGVFESSSKCEDTNTFTFTQKGIHDFAWFAADSILAETDYYKSSNKEIRIELFIQPEREEYLSRYSNAVKNCLEYFEKYVGEYPYEKVTLIDVPRTSKSGGMEYPTLFTVSADLFSPVEVGYPEKLVAHEFAHQYFHGIIANNETYEGWIDEGLASYFATKIMEEYYPDLLINFRLASYFPVFGIQLLNYNEIPLIYSIDKYKQAPAYRQYINYYSNPIQGKISDSSFIHDSKIVFRNTNYSKPELMFISLERIIDEREFLQIISEFYNRYKFKHPKGRDLIDLIKSNSSEELDWFFDGVYNNDVRFDYSVKSIIVTDSLNYKIELVRNEEGIFYNDILVVTENDSLWFKWEDSSRTKYLDVKTESQLYGVEIDPFRKNVFDYNYANNSLKVSSNIWPALSLSIRWFFWIQNALMVLGSIG